VFCARTRSSASVTTTGCGVLAIHAYCDRSRRPPTSPDVASTWLEDSSRTRSIYLSSRRRHRPNGRYREAERLPILIVRGAVARVRRGCDAPGVTDPHRARKSELVSLLVSCTAEVSRSLNTAAVRAGNARVEKASRCQRQLRSSKRLARRYDGGLERRSSSMNVAQARTTHPSSGTSACEIPRTRGRCAPALVGCAISRDR
jgi:hypothetical protein